jgi:hypothetical protein
MIFKRPKSATALFERIYKLLEEINVNIKQMHHVSVIEKKTLEKVESFVPSIKAPNVDIHVELQKGVTTKDVDSRTSQLKGVYEVSFKGSPNEIK